MTVDKLTGIESGIEIAKKINEIIDDKAEMNSDTTGNAATASKLKDARQISLTGDIVGSASFDGSENKSITTELQNTTKIDGQWVSKVQTLSTATEVGTYEIDLSDYLPDDNYNYEVLMNFVGRRVASGSGTTAIANIISDSLTVEALRAIHISSNYASGTSMWNNNAFTLPLKTRIITLDITKAFKDLTVSALAYRRIGTNS